MHKYIIAAGPTTTVKSILGDTHFWVPLAVLVGGLILLAWVS